MHADLVIAAE
jgi:predicted PilT family ATPase